MQRPKIGNALGGFEEHTGMNDVHGAHGTARIVKHPLLVQVDKARRSGSAMELIDNIAHNAARVVAVRSNTALGKIM